MKKIIIQVCFSILTGSLFAQGTKTITLIPPDLSRGFPAMKALSLRSSATDWDTTSLNFRDLSDLLWAANGVNRPETGKRTAPSAFNAQDIDIYVFMKPGIFLYNANQHILELVVDGDYRNLIAGQQENVAKY